MRNVVASAIQMQCGDNPQKNIFTAERLIRSAAEKGAHIMLLPELFERRYFCQERNYDYYGFASETEKNPAVAHFTKISGELSAVIVVSFFERENNSFYNSAAIIDCGHLLGVYRKTHIPDDHFYQEKFYFTPGDSGFCVWDTTQGRIGVGICWDQWFPETARCMALDGAELLLYPTAIGSEPLLGCDSMPHWRRCMKGHAAANLVPVIAANRVGREQVIPSQANNFQSSELEFYGSSFMTDGKGDIVAAAERCGECVLTAQYDLDKLFCERTEWGVFRDRRPAEYARICGEKCR